MSCCDDPTGPSKIDPRELIREHDCMDAGGRATQEHLPRSITVIWYAICLPMILKKSFSNN